MKNQTTSKQKIYLSKVKKIIEYRKTHTLQETGDRFGLTMERVRQIEFMKYRKRCKVHNRYYYNKCSYCSIKSYKTMLGFMLRKDIDNEVRKQAANKKRDYLSVQRRTYLIEILHDKFQESFTKIAYELKKDRTSIIHLYNKQNGTK